MNADTTYRSFIWPGTIEEQLSELPEAEEIKFRRAISRFCLQGKEPLFDGALKALWIGMKTLLLNINRKHWASQANGKNHTGKPGTYPDEEAETEISKISNGTYPILSDPTGTYPENAKSPKTYSEEEAIVVGNRYRDKDSNSSGSSITDNPTTTTTTNFQQTLKQLGFSISEGKALELAASIPPEWACGPFSFPEYLAKTWLRENYPEKPPGEQARLFIGAFGYGNVRETYLKWREARLNPPPEPSGLPPPIDDPRPESLEEREAIIAEITGLTTAQAADADIY